MESVSIPAGLRSYGYDNATALSVYGVLTGMAFPMIFFPNALTGSVSVMLLPMISECYARGDDQGIRRAVLRTVKYWAWPAWAFSFSQAGSWGRDCTAAPWRDILSAP